MRSLELSVRSVLLHPCVPRVLGASPAPSGQPSQCRAVPESEGRCIGAKFSLVLLSGSGIKAAPCVFVVGAGLSRSGASGWHCCRGPMAAHLWGVSGCDSFMRQWQSCPTFLYFKLQRLNTGGWKI